jgi:hypothetical protein
MHMAMAIMRMLPQMEVGRDILKSNVPAMARFVKDELKAWASKLTASLGSATAVA